MAVEPSEVRVDWCFVTARNQVRRVIEVTSDKARYVARGRHSDHPWGPRRSNTQHDRYPLERSREISGASSMARFA